MSLGQRLLQMQKKSKSYYGRPNLYTMYTHILYNYSDLNVLSLASFCICAKWCSLFNSLLAHRLSLVVKILNMIVSNQESKLT